jgi:hypothetical protein
VRLRRVLADHKLGRYLRVGQTACDAGIGATTEAYAVTGGTGAYVGASGTMTRKGNGKRDTLTFTLQ